MTAPRAWSEPDAKIARVDFANIDLESVREMDISQFNVDEIVGCIADRNANVWQRDHAIAVATELVAPKEDGDLPTEPDDLKLINSIIEIGSDPTQPPLLRERAGDSLGLVWMWGYNWSPIVFQSLTPSAQRAARRILGQVHPEWVESIPEPDE